MSDAYLGIFIKSYKISQLIHTKNFHASELGSLHSVLPFESIAKEIGLSQSRLGRRNCFSPSAKIALMVLKAYTGFSDRLLVKILSKTVKAVQHPNKTIHQKEKTSCEDNFHRETWKKSFIPFYFYSFARSFI